MTVIVGDCRTVMSQMDADSVDAVVCDPPYDLTGGSRNGSPRQNDPTKPYGRHNLQPVGGFMNKQWDGTGVAFDPETWASVYRVLRPGGHLLAFGGTRTSHRMVCAIEDAGFEIRDEISVHGLPARIDWVMGSGFPKSHAVTKKAKELGLACSCENQQQPQSGGAWPHCSRCGLPILPNGLGSALKPAHEPICVARKPLVGTLVDNTLRYGTGAINVDACRIGTTAAFIDRPGRRSSGGLLNVTEDSRVTSGGAGRWPANVILSHSPDCREVGTKRVKTQWSQAKERDTSAHGYDGGWKKRDGENIGYADADGMETVTAWECVEGCPVAMLDAQSGETKSSAAIRKNSGGVLKYGGTNARPSHDTFTKETTGYQDQGGSSRFFFNVSWQPGELDEARFFYAAKASRRERNAGLEGMPERRVKVAVPPGEGRSRNLDGITEDGKWVTPPRANDHPTVKPVALMRYLVRLVIPPGGTCLDPFMGGGTTGMACVLEGFDFIGIEQDEHYANDIAAHRIAHVERHGERWLDAAKGPKYAASALMMSQNEGQKVKVCALCERRCANGSAVCPACGGALEWRVQAEERRRRGESARDEPRHTVPSTDTPTLTDLPLFALVAD